MMYACCDERRLRRGQARRAPPTASSSSRSRTPRRRPQALRQRTLFVRLLRPPADRRGQRRDRRRRAAPSRSPGRVGRVGRHRGVPPRGARPSRRRWSPGSTTWRPCCVVRTDDRAATSRTYTLRLVAGAGSAEPPAGFDPMLARDRVLVQGRVPVRLRLRAGAATARRSRPTRPTIDYLAKDYQLPPPDARPAEPARAGLDRALAGRPRRHAGRAARLRRRQALLPPGRDRQRGLPRAPRAGACRCAGMRGWSTTPCTRAATRAPWCTSTVDGRRRRTSPRGTRAADPRRRTSPTVVEPGGPEHRARRSRPARRVVRDGAERPTVLDRVCTSAVDFYTWGDDGLLPAARRDARDAARPPRRELQVGDVLVFAEVAGPTTGSADGRRPGEARGRCG